MKVEGLQKVSQTVGNMFAKNSPTILTGLGVAGLITTVVMAVRVTPKAMEIINEERLDRADADENFIYGSTKMEVIRLVWPCYIPTLVMGCATIACIIGANSINLRRNAALASVYSLTEATLKEYQAKVIETIGENKEHKIKDEIAKDQVRNHPLNDKEVILTGKGNTLCYDVISGRYFKNDIENIRKVRNDLNQEFLNGEMFISLNDLYYALGLSNTKMGDEIGWSIDDGQIEFNFSSQLAEDGIPCLVLDYSLDPKYNYDLP